MTPPERNFFPPSSVSTLSTPTEKRYVAQNAAQCAHFLKRPYQWDNTIVHLWKCDKCCNFTFRQRRHGNEKKIIVESNCAEWNWPKVFVNVVLPFAKSDWETKWCTTHRQKMFRSVSLHILIFMKQMNLQCYHEIFFLVLSALFFWSDSIVTSSLPCYKLQYKNLNLDHYS